MAGQSALIVFLRLPEKGNVKTRIAQTLGEEAALGIYKELVELTLKTCALMSCPVFLYFTPALPDATDRIPGLIYRIQSPGDLGKKMAHAFAEVVEDYQSVVLIGSDCPYLTEAMILESFRALNECDVVLGPAADGGYYLIGCHTVQSSLFENIPWGTNAVLNETIQAIGKERMTYALLEILHDIDTAEDWTRYVHFKTQST